MQLEPHGGSRWEEKGLCVSSGDCTIPVEPVFPISRILLGCQHLCAGTFPCFSRLCYPQTLLGRGFFFSLGKLVADGGTGISPHTFSSLGPHKWQVCFSNTQVSTEDLTLTLPPRAACSAGTAGMCWLLNHELRSVCPHLAFRSPSIWLRDFTPVSAGLSTTTSVCAGNSCLPSIKVLHRSKEEDQGREGGVATNLHAEVF